VATYATLTLSDVIEETLAILYRPTERPRQCMLGSNALTALDTDTTFTLSGTYTAVQATTIIEIGNELILCTAKSADATPVFTCVRGYAGTPVEAHTTGDAVLMSPTWSRYDIRRAILRCFRGVLTTYLPFITSTTLDVVASADYIALPSNCIEVHRVGLTALENESHSMWRELPNWSFIEDIPTSIVSSGKILTHPYGFTAGQDLFVTYQAPYAWSGATEDPADSETISIPAGAQDLPSMYAAAFMVLNREVTRLELDRIEEWNQEAAIRQGVNLRLAQSLWSEFYKRLDEARRQQNVPKYRPFRKMAPLHGGRWVNGGRNWRRQVV
jgi:hypothetical protein